MVEDPLHDEEGMEQPSRPLPHAVVQQPRDAGVVEEREQMHLALEASVPGVQGQLEGPRPCVP
jgi:hypothetical protein